MEDGTVARAPVPAPGAPVGLAAAGTHPDNVERNETVEATIADNVAAVENGEETTVAQAHTDNNTDTVEIGGGTTDTDKVMWRQLRLAVVFQCVGVFYNGVIYF